MSETEPAWGAGGGQHQPVLESLWKKVETELTSARVELAAGVEPVLRAMIEGGDRQLLEEPGRYPEAADNVTTFMQALVAEARGAETVALDLSILKRVKSRLCPIFPIC